MNKGTEKGWLPAIPSSAEILTGTIAGIVMFVAAVIAIGPSAMGDGLGLSQLLELSGAHYPAAVSVATLAFALSGAYGIARKKAASGLSQSLVGGLMTGVGGGLIRDVVFLTRKPVLFSDPTLICLAVIGAAIGLLLATRRSAAISAAVDAADFMSVGVTSVFALSLAQTLSPVGDFTCTAALITVVTACGGGIVRDIRERRPPSAFVSLYLLLSIAASLLTTRGAIELAHFGSVADATAFWPLPAFTVTIVGISTRHIRLIALRAMPSAGQIDKRKLPASEP
jgi:uncharacterized membrane protein YeiH